MTELGCHTGVILHIVDYDGFIGRKIKKVNKIGYIQRYIRWCIIQSVVLCYKIKERRNLL